jgi:phospholipase C
MPKNVTRRVTTSVAVLAIVAASTAIAAASAPASEPEAAKGIHKIKHVVVIMQENRSFDEYFGTYPGADGLPTKKGEFTSCTPDPAGPCQKPYHDPNDINGGAAHGAEAATTSINGGKMDGFVQVARTSQRGCADQTNPVCSASTTPDVMGYHDAREIPNYWKYANDFVLQDHMFEPVASWSLPAHLYMVSGWSALCSSADPATCQNQIVGPYPPRQIQTAERRGTPEINFAWTDLTYLLQKNKVSWGYYVETGSEPDCEDDAATCAPVAQRASTPGIWNPLPLFNDVKDAGQSANVTDVKAFRTAAKNGTLPAVSWITPAQVHSEHAPASIHTGQAWVTGLINDAMRGKDWDSTAVFVSWDDWGGFYDHVVPPSVDENGYGLRVPGLVVSAYAKKGYIDHQTLSHDAYLKFIEDDFLGGARIDPKTDGRPDPRPDVRENAKRLGDLAKDFDFTQSPRKPEILPTDPQPGKASRP